LKKIQSEAYTATTNKRAKKYGELPHPLTKILGKANSFLICEADFSVPSGF
jgi:hypothetical protein